MNGIVTFPTARSLNYAMKGGFEPGPLMSKDTTHAVAARKFIPLAPSPLAKPNV